MGSRDAKNEKASSLGRAAGRGASQGTFADAAAFGEIVFNCTPGERLVDALDVRRRRALDGKVLVDVSNPLDFSKGMPPTLFAPHRRFARRAIQRTFPRRDGRQGAQHGQRERHGEPGRLAGDHDLFVCGNDADAKAQVIGLLERRFGWKTVHDLGDITAARATESYLLLWLRLYGALQTADFNVRVVR